MISTTTVVSFASNSSGHDDCAARACCSFDKTETHFILLLQLELVTVLIVAIDMIGW